MVEDDGVAEFPNAEAEKKSEDEREQLRRVYLAANGVRLQFIFHLVAKIRAVVPNDALSPEPKNSGTNTSPRPSPHFAPPTPQNAEREKRSPRPGQSGADFGAVLICSRSAGL